MVVRWITMPDAGARGAMLQRIADASKDGGVLMVCFERTAAVAAKDLATMGAILENVTFIDATDGRHATARADLRILHSSPIQLERIGMLAAKAADQWGQEQYTVVIDNVNRILDYNPEGAVTQMAHYVVNHLKRASSTHEWIWCGERTPPEALLTLTDEQVRIASTVSKKAAERPPRPDLRFK